MGNETEKDRLSEAARIMGSKGGSKGGKTSAQNLTGKQRKDRSVKANKARWKKYRENKEKKTS